MASQPWPGALLLWEKIILYMTQVIRIGTRESQLAVWQATEVKKLLAAAGIAAELEYIRSEGDIDLKTPLYEMGVQGIFTRSLDTALLNDRIDMAVHSMKDVPTQLPEGIAQAAVLKRASYKDLLIFKGAKEKIDKALHTYQGSNGSSIRKTPFTVATSSIRRKAQWLNRYPHHTITNLRGNVNTRLKKLEESDWNGAVFAAAGLERIDLRPSNSMELDWMLPAPAQGAIMVVCRSTDQKILEACSGFNDQHTAICTAIERDFLRGLLGGCSTPISALAEVTGGSVRFQGNILSVDGKMKATIEKNIPLDCYRQAGSELANELLASGGQVIAESIRKQTNQ